MFVKSTRFKQVCQLLLSLIAVSTIQLLSTSLYACFRRMHVLNMLATQVSPQYHNMTYMYMYYSADRKTMDHSSNWVVLSISDADVIYQKQV